MKNILSFSLLAVLLLPVARADVILGNLVAPTTVPADVSRNSPLSYVTSGSAFYWKAVAFTMGATAYDATSLTLTLESVSQAYPLSVTIFSNNNGTPASGNTPLYTFSIDPASALLSQSASAQNYTFDAPTNALLGAGTTYWIVVRQLNTSGSAPQSKWMLGASSGTPTSSVGATAAGAVFGQSNSSDPSKYASGGGGTSSSYNWFELDGTVPSAIPEPGACAAVLGAAAGLMVLGGRFRRRRS